MVDLYDQAANTLVHDPSPIRWFAISSSRDILEDAEGRCKYVEGDWAKLGYKCTTASSLPVKLTALDHVWNWWSHSLSFIFFHGLPATHNTHCSSILDMYYHFAILVEKPCSWLIGLCYFNLLEALYPDINQKRWGYLRCSLHLKPWIISFDWDFSVAFSKCLLCSVVVSLWLLFWPVNAIHIHVCMYISMRTYKLLCR